MAAAAERAAGGASSGWRRVASPLQTATPRRLSRGKEGRVHRRPLTQRVGGRCCCCRLVRVRRWRHAAVCTVRRRRRQRRPRDCREPPAFGDETSVHHRSPRRRRGNQCRHNVHLIDWWVQINTDVGAGVLTDDAISVLLPQPGISAASTWSTSRTEQDNFGWPTRSEDTISIHFHTGFTLGSSSISQWPL